MLEVIVIENGVTRYRHTSKVFTSASTDFILNKFGPVGTLIFELNEVEEQAKLKNNQLIEPNKGE